MEGDVAPEQSCHAGMLIGRNGDKGQSLLWTSLPALSRTVQEGDVDVVDSKVS